MRLLEVGGPASLMPVEILGKFLLDDQARRR
jgi:hypothetical protein